MPQGPTNVLSPLSAQNLIETPLPFPRPFGDFELLRPLAFDERGDTYVALRPEGVDRLCVVTVLAPDLAARADLIDGLKAEASWLVRRVHGHIVQIYDVGQVDDGLFFVSELVEGRDLATVLDRLRARNRTLPLDAVLQIGIDVADAFEFVRAGEERTTGVKTSFLGNRASSVLIGSDGRAKLLHQGSCIAPKAGELGGNDHQRASLLPPECVDDAAWTPRSDVYALGALVWQALTGRPLAGESVDGHVQALRAGTFVAPKPSSIDGATPDVPEPVELAVLAALARKPENRPADVAAFRAELVSALKKSGADGEEVTRALIAELFGHELATEAAEITQLVARIDAERAPVEGPRRPSVTLTNFDAKRRRTPLPPLPELALNQVIPGTRYRALSKLGEGGMGAVYLAEHVDIEKRVALKLLHAELLANPVVLQQFRQEARAASKIGNPYICDVTDWGEVADGRVFFVMEYLDGVSLSKVVKKVRRMPPGRVIPILRQVAKALGAAHEKGIVHLDIKPDNVLLLAKEHRQDLVKVVDFGIAGLLGQGGAGAKVMGTPEYMAPERTTGGGYDHRSDVYSMGIMAYEMLVGEVPFQAPSAAELLAMQAMDTPDAINERLTTPVPDALEAVVMRMIEKDPARRPQSMAEVEALLCEAQADARIRTPWDDLPLPVIDPERARRITSRMQGVNRTRVILGAAGGVAALAVLVALVAVTRGREQRVEVLVPQPPPPPAAAAPAPQPVEPPVGSATAPAATLLPAATPLPPGKTRPGATLKTDASRKRPGGATAAAPGTEPVDTEAASASSRDLSKAKEAVSRGAAAFDKGMIQLAEREYKEALANDPQNLEAMAGLAKVKFEQSEYRESRSLAERVLRRRPRSGDVQLLLGNACYKLALYKEAIDAYEKARDLGHKEAQTWLEAAQRKLGGN